MMKKVRSPWLGQEGYDCIACSPTNPIGLKMEFYVDGEEMIGIWKSKPHYNGWCGVVHGGIQSLMLDEVGAWWVHYFKQSATVTARLDVKFIKSVKSSWPEIKLKATKVRDLRKFVALHIELLSPEGEVCGSAEGTYYIVPKEESEKDYGFYGCFLEEDCK
ncbi:MAG: PaaI family thioesterase [Paludibacteraceae bacterium]|jgi:uncharacterized protein (TIGR00369 family)|nr:PaaI family thioesterase [Paludibacteraceae bacterium]